MRIEHQIGTALTETTNVIVYAEFDNSTEINGLREVIIDYYTHAKWIQKRKNHWCSKLTSTDGHSVFWFR